MRGVRECMRLLSAGARTEPKACKALAGAEGVHGQCLRRCFDPGGGQEG